MGFFWGGERKRAEGREEGCGGGSRVPGWPGDRALGGMSVIWGLSPLCSKGEEAEKGLGTEEGLSPCSVSPGDAQARDPQQEQDPTLPGDGRKGRG